jgi:hypothetical protein
VLVGEGRNRERDGGDARDGEGAALADVHVSS